MKVKNLNGPGHIPSGTESWLTCWEKTRRQTAYLCSTQDCITQPTVGGLVQRDDPRDDGWYIVPLCKDCNARTGQDLDVWDLSVLVPIARPVLAPSRRSPLHQPLARPVGQPA